MCSLTVSNARALPGKTLFALVDVEVQLAGFAFQVLDVQARRLPAGSTSMHLPTLKDTYGTWRPALKMPEEARALLADAVLLFLVEEGVARRRFEPSAMVSSSATPVQNPCFVHISALGAGCVETRMPAIAAQHPSRLGLRASI